MEFHKHKGRVSGKFILDFMNQHGFQPGLPMGVSLQNEWPWDVQWAKRIKNNTSISDNFVSKHISITIIS